jgi:hypothetical protein
LIFEVTEGRILPLPITNQQSSIVNSSRRLVKQPGPYGIYRFHHPGPVQNSAVTGRPVIASTLAKRIARVFHCECIIWPRRDS